jgi:hypothetical protein
MSYEPVMSSNVLGLSVDSSHVMLDVGQVLNYEDRNE